MSVLSYQCDELRTYAMWVRDKISHVNGQRAAKLMEEAADTIWRLRDQNLELHDKVDELEEQNDHLREDIETLWPRAAFTMSKPCKEQWIEDLAELGVEVTDDERSEY